MNGSPGIKKGLSEETLFCFARSRVTATVAARRWQLLEADSNSQQLPGTAVDTPDATGKHSHILCAHCRHRVTHAQFRIELNNQHIYCFRNPAGIDFVICCYSEAQGCVAAGDWAAEHSWFKGYLWTPVLCTACSNHLGWAYSNTGGQHFYGLIMDQLLEERPI